MKKWLLGIIITCIIMSGSFCTAAPHHGRFGGPGKFEGGPQRMREDASRIIHRTAEVLIEARRAVERRHRFIGLARAMANQRFARRLFFEGSYQEAIYHSLRARQIAVQIIRANHGRIRPEFFRDSSERHYARNIPRNEDLDQRVDYKDLEKDDDAVRIQIDLDVHN